jgi:hypothetical protein
MGVRTLALAQAIQRLASSMRRTIVFPSDAVKDCESSSASFWRRPRARAAACARSTREMTRKKIQIDK